MADVNLSREIERYPRPSVADQVFDLLLEQIVSLRLLPGAKISEVDVASQFGVSRQPVRDAFFRLSSMGFLNIRPQRATTVSLISHVAVMRARFIRAAIETETVRVACERLTTADLVVLDENLAEQKLAVDARDQEAFHRLDDEFHHQICERTDCGFAWAIIQHNKFHIDRVRLLSLAFAAQDAFDDHLNVMDAIRARDSSAAMVRMRKHLSRIKTQIVRIKADNPAYFVSNEPEGVDL